jgi:curved DNA-binding protein CbpA
MEFIDYYELLEITPAATAEEMGTAFKRQAIKWHPDKNPGTDTTERMQRINEARLILADPEARKRYDAAFAHHFREPGTTGEHRAEEPTPQDQAQRTTSRAKVVDEDLARWMENARRQSVDLARQTIKDFTGMSKVAVKEGVKTFGQYIAAYAVSGLLVTFFFAMMRGCS